MVEAGPTSNPEGIRGRPLAGAQRLQMKDLRFQILTELHTEQKPL
jgi:hypothetical protein